MTSVLVIGYGNPLRSDDALGWRAVAQLEAALQNLPEVEVHACQQLTPELAVALSKAQLALFIDASIDDAPGKVHCRKVEKDTFLPTQFSHDFTPAKLLAFTEVLYANVPEAFLYSIGAESFALGENLSSAVEAALPDLLSRVEKQVTAALMPAAPVVL
jgi:hydrogenase maturation protease